MPSQIGRDEVQRLRAEEGAQIVEVLPKEEYEDEHIAGAVHIPLRKLDASRTAALDKDRPVIVYCWDYQ